ncbi:sugar ABC transporter permease [Kocuria palustris]|jgi:sorbitol/mannitol transport system permease protein|uniref:Various polyols ABC transporter, permease component 1 n=3 Tax=Bacteria TaxID=2 RepID=M2WB30_9MICC|nr:MULTISPECIES: sugar ABC transporter permease [Kocuria]EME35687.1 Various polyols ABC transporter, permease component 1 [Kocuria palustris PEL]MBM7823225.1 sorbitol/mannitol transport system permease protein [Kocuria palustris]MBN6754188.1 sugar ABC transporter permease [Kocuria palustris]MBN6757854.1 sugar ABC transporter permease [Kocuria palustris]MBN6762882.1 sugar ABC transporter permease [Kocuria palustris]
MSTVATPSGTRAAEPASRRSAEERAKRDAFRRRLPLLPALIFTIALTQLPFLITIWYSLRSWNLLNEDSDRFVGLRNYLAIFTDSTFRGAALNSILYTLACVLFALILGMIFALLLDRAFLGRGLARTLLITPFLIMPVASAMLWSVSMFNPSYGLVNWMIGLVGIDPVDWTSQMPRISVIVALVWQWTPFMMLLLLAGLQSQPRDVLEAARVDGASKIQSFVLITLPHMRRYIELCVLLGAIYVVNTFDQIYLMTAGGPGTQSANLPFYIYQRAFLGFDVGQAAAMGVVVVIGTIIIATWALRLMFKSFMTTEQ